MLNVAVPLYALAQYLQLDALCKDIASRMLLFNQKDANDTQHQCESSMADTRLTRLRTFSMDNFIKLAKAAYNIPNFGPNSVRETSIRTPFPYTFNRYPTAEGQQVKSTESVG
ncbi:hypothetical protein MMYC01_206362 [Madurella mycetomatis]|uniref:Uncharacterized protein n=1 Tax=Madurella mycetomatis TaxID=100816 RepID=A0A175W4C1_9PEZI|nr:hypothetical protein MMYC01_206362 [Madurella mycetomatis]